MSTFDSLFGSQELPRLKREIKRVRGEVSATYDPLGKLGAAIVRAADARRRESAPKLGFRSRVPPPNSRSL